MATSAYQSYEEAARDYLTKFQVLREAKPAEIETITRGAGDIPVDELINRADEIADVSENMVPLSKKYLEAPEPQVREGMSGQLLSQAAAELQVAAELLEIAGEDQTGKPEVRTIRAVRGIALREAIDTLEKSMEKPVTEGLPIKFKGTRATLPDDLDKAKADLKQAATTTVGFISQQVIEVGGDLAFTLVFNTEWNAVVESAGIMSSNIAKLLEDIKKGVGAFSERIFNVVTKTLINVYDKILALLGKDLEDQARKKIQEWLASIEKEGKIDLFDQLVGKLYRIEHFKDELGNWIDATKMEVDKINHTTEAVEELSKKFPILAGRMKKISDIAGLARFIKAPPVLVVITGIQVALLASLVYAGHDYIGYKQIRFPNLTKGVAEVIQENLVIG